MIRLKTTLHRATRVWRPGDRWRHGDGVAMYWHASEPNFGDRLSPVIVSHALDTTPHWVPPTFGAKVVALGSVAHVIAPGDLVLGTGAVDDTPLTLPRRTRVLAVRGPRTARALGLTGDIAFGDPGLLAPRVLPPTVQEPVSGRVAIIAHARHRDAVVAALPGIPHDPDRVDVIDLADPPADVIDRIAAAEAVVSSALHGVIVAEAFGRPVQWFEIGEQLKGGRFKFLDHFEASGRHGMAPTDLAAALAAAQAGDLAPFTPDPSGIESAMRTAAALRE